MAPKKHKKTTSSQYHMLEDDHLSNDMQTLFNEDNESFTPDASHSADDSGDEGDEGDDEEDERTRRAATTVESNPVEREKRRLLPKRKTRGKTRRYDSMVDVDESSDEDLDRYEKIPVPKEKEKMKLKKNPPTYVFLKTNVKRCQGCYQIFENFQRKAPNNLVFQVCD